MKEMVKNNWIPFVIGAIVGALILYWFACKSIKEHEEIAHDEMKKFLKNHADATGKDILDTYEKAMAGQMPEVKN